MDHKKSISVTIERNGPTLMCSLSEEEGSGMGYVYYPQMTLRKNKTVQVLSPGSYEKTLRSKNARKIFFFLESFEID